MSIMEANFLQLQRYFKMKYFRNIFNKYYDLDKLNIMSYDKFMRWCSSRTTASSSAGDAVGV